jgi:gliding motility-associated-like protein
MKYSKLFPVIIFILALHLTVMYGQGWSVSKVINGTLIEPQYSAIDDQNNLYVLAHFGDTIYSPYSIVTYGLRDLFLFKINGLGNVLWYKRIGGPGLEAVGGLTLDNNNNCYVTGTYYKSCRFTSTDSLIHTGNGDIFLAQYNSDGGFQWAKRVGSSSTMQSSIDLKFDGNDHLIMAGFFKDSLVIGSNASDRDTLLGNANVATFISQFDLNGNHVWSKRFLSTNTLTRIRKIAISENGFYFGGYFQGSVTFDISTITSYFATTYDAFVYKTDHDGNEQWVRRIRGLGTENFKSLSTDEYDNVYVLGNYNSSTIYVDSTATIAKTFNGNTGGYDTYIGKYNRSGVLQWFLRKGSTAKDIYNDFVVRNNLIYATGYFANQIIFNDDTLRTSGATNEDAFVAAFNEIGDPISGVSIQGTGNYNDAGTIVNMDASSRAYVSGYYKSQQIKIGTQTYTSSNVNKSDLFFAIYQQPFKAVITEHQNISCHGLSDGLLRVTPYFGAPPYTYSWSHNPALNLGVATNLSPGTYTVTITDINNQQASIPATITQPDTIVITGTITPVGCLNGGDGSVDITVSGGTKATDYNYYWTSLDGSGISPLDQNQAGLTRGTYTVTVKDDNNCSVSEDFTVTQPEPFTYSGTVVTDISTGIEGAIDLSFNGGNPPYTFAWTGPGGFTASTDSISSLTAGGLYSLSVIDNKGCTTDTGFVVNDGIVFIVQITSKTDVLCYGDGNGSAVVTTTNGVAPFTYQWNDGVTLNQPTRINMIPGDYIVLVTDNSFRVASAPITILGPLAGLTPVLVPADPFCYHDNSGVVDLTITGGTTPYTFSWNNGLYTGEDLVNVGGGTYTVVITDANDCFIQPPSAVLTEPDTLTVEIVFTGEELCYGDKLVTATANITSGTGPFSYLWDDPGAQVTNPANELEAGPISVKVTNLNGCFATDSKTIEGKDSLFIQAVLTDPSCPGLADGSIEPNISGGTPVFDYVWSNNVFDRLNPNIPAGSYTLTVTDANNCSLVKDYILTNPDTVKIVTVDITDMTCLGLTDGSIKISATGGTGTYEYSIDNGVNFVTNDSIGSLANGDYIIVVKDDNGCTSESYPATLTITDTVSIVSVDITDVTCLGLSDGSVSVIATGGTGTYEYSTDDGGNFVLNDSIGSLAEGAYAIVVKDGNGCVSENYLVTLIALDTVKIISVDVSDATCSGLPDGSVTIIATGGTGTYDYSADGGGNFVTASTIGSLAEGDYTIVVKDGDGCNSEDHPVTISRTESCALVIYDAFSPNGDDKNPVWNIGNVVNFPNIKVKIFNLWGKMVFSSTGYGTPWDGKYEGKELPSGTYYYVIDPGDGSDILNGAVSIVK